MLRILPKLQHDHRGGYMLEQRGKVNKQRILALAFLVFLLLLLVFLLWWWFGRTVTPEGQTPDTPQVGEKIVLPSQRPTNTVPTVTRDVPSLSDGELQVMSLARNFTERYGSWSTESEFQNLADLYPNITTRLRREFDQTIRSSVVANDYRGLDTKAINISINTLTDIFADVTVSAQQVVTDSSYKQSVQYTQYTLTMKRIGDFWYVDTVATE